MDRRLRNYYKVRFQYRSKEMRIGYLKCIEGVKIHQKSWDNEYKGPVVIVSCYKKDSESVEYQLRKAERRDDYCEWEQV